MTTGGFVDGSRLLSFLSLVLYVKRVGQHDVFSVPPNRTRDAERETRKCTKLSVRASIT